MAAEVGVNWNLLASIEQYETKSLTNRTETEIGDALLDEVKGYVKSSVLVGLMQLQESAVEKAAGEAPWIADVFGLENADLIWL